MIDIIATNIVIKYSKGNSFFTKQKMVTFLQLLEADATIFKIYNYEPYFPLENIKSDLPGTFSLTDHEDPNIMYLYKNGVEFNEDNKLKVYKMMEQNEKFN